MPRPYHKPANFVNTIIKAELRLHHYNAIIAITSISSRCSLPVSSGSALRCVRATKCKENRPTLRGRRPWVPLAFPKPACSAAPFKGAGLDRVREGPAFGAGATVLALEPVVPFRLGIGIVGQGERRVVAQTCCWRATVAPSCGDRRLLDCGSVGIFDIPPAGGNRLITL